MHTKQFPDGSFNGDPDLSIQVLHLVAQYLFVAKEIERDTEFVLALALTSKSLCGIFRHNGLLERVRNSHIAHRSELILRIQNWDTITDVVLKRMTNEELALLFHINKLWSERYVGLTNVVGGLSKLPPKYWLPILQLAAFYEAKDYESFHRDSREYLLENYLPEKKHRPIAEVVDAFLSSYLKRFEVERVCAALAFFVSEWSAFDFNKTHEMKERVLKVLLPQLNTVKQLVRSFAALQVCSLDIESIFSEEDFFYLLISAIKNIEDLAYLFSHSKGARSYLSQPIEFIQTRCSRMQRFLDFVQLMLGANVRDLKSLTTLLIETVKLDERGFGQGFPHGGLFPLYGVGEQGLCFVPIQLPSAKLNVEALKTLKLSFDRMRSTQYDSRSPDYVEVHKRFLEMCNPKTLQEISGFERADYDPRIHWALTQGGALYDLPEPHNMEELLVLLTFGTRGYTSTHSILEYLHRNLALVKNSQEAKKFLRVVCLHQISRDGEPNMRAVVALFHAVVQHCKPFIQNFSDLEDVVTYLLPEAQVALVKACHEFIQTPEQLARVIQSCASYEACFDVLRTKPQWIRQEAVFNTLLQILSIPTGNPFQEDILAQVIQTLKMHWVQHRSLLKPSLWEQITYGWRRVVPQESESSSPVYSKLMF